MFLGRTLKSRILIVNLIVGFILVASIVSVFYFTTRSNTLAEKRNVVALEVQREKVLLEREFSKAYKTAQQMSVQVENMIENGFLTNGRDELINLAEMTIEQNENIIGINYIFEPNVIESDALFAGDSRFQYDGQFVSYISQNSGIYTTVYINNFETYEMYYRALQDKSAFFTEPYEFRINGVDQIVTTVVFPIIQNGEVLGLVGINVTAEYILSRVHTVDSTYERRDIVVSQDGIIMINSDDESSAGNHISTIHPEYYIAISSVNTSGVRISNMENMNHTEVIMKTDLGSTGDHWYIFSDVDNSLLMADVNQSSYFSILTGIVILILYVIVSISLTRTLTKPVTHLSNVINNFDLLEDSVDTIQIDSKKLEDINQLTKVIINSYQSIKDNIIQQEQTNALTNRQMDLRKSIEDSMSLQSLSDNLLETLKMQTGSFICTLYVYQNNAFHLMSNIGASTDVVTKFSPGEGVLGDVAETKKTQIIEHNAFSPIIDIAIGKVQPPYVYIKPIINEKQTIALVQLVALNPFEPEILTYLDSINYFISNALIRQISNEKTKALYQESLKLTQELEVQQEELRVKNEELESQQEELRVTNEELESQQEELRVTNKELQFNIGQIEQMNDELTKTKKELESRTSEAEQSNQYKSDFLANMSHELRTPLNSILILSNLIKDQEQSSEKLKEYADTIHEAGSDLLELINGILDLSKVEAGKDEVVNDKWTVCDGLVDLNNRFQLLAKNKGLDYHFEGLQSPIVIETDISKSKTILSNLLANAIKFTEKGSVHFEVFDHPNEVEFRIKDTGVGIKPDQIELIFEEFRQADTGNKKAFGGTGLGLSIAKQYAMLIGGRIHVESNEKQGSIFTLFIPKQPNKVQHEQLKVRQTTKPSHRVHDDSIVTDDRHNLNHDFPTILVIDDDEKTLTTIRDYFRTKNINVIVTNTGENGLFLADYYIPRLIMLDLRLPRLHGEDILEKLMANHRTKEIPIVLISGLDTPKNNSLPFYKKPLTPQALTAIQKRIPSKKKNAHHILFVEDDELHLRSMVEYVESHKELENIIIDTSSTMKETLKKIDIHSYSLLVVDLHLSDSKEFELVEAIRKHKSYQKTPIIVYTGKRFSQQDESYLSELVNDIIIKAGKSPERLLHDIQLFLRGYETQNVKTDRSIFENKKILIVDDDIRNIFALTGLLETYGINVVFDTSGINALTRLEANPELDLILMDIMMPELDGFETMKRIRLMTNYNTIPMIALTAKTMRGDREKCIQAGATEYLSKPVNKDKLFSVLRVWLQ